MSLKGGLDLCKQGKKKMRGVNEEGAVLDNSIKCDNVSDVCYDIRSEGGSSNRYSHDVIIYILRLT